MKLGFLSYEKFALVCLFAARQGFVPLFLIRYAHKNAGRGSLVRRLGSSSHRCAVRILVLGGYNDKIRYQTVPDFDRSCVSSSG